jgi:GT2 family glycosyltransferase
LTGLAALFPQSKIFNKYSLGYLSINENHEVDVLCGAFMMLKKEVAEKTNGFDTAFFMYGEDIDLSFRIQKLGYKNYYFSESSIIHFKGESATQQSFKHNKMFYKAMIVFVKKHYGGSKATLFLLLLQLAIVFRAIVGWLGKLVKFVFSISASKQTENFLLLGEATETEKVKQLLITKKIEVLPIKDARHLQLSAIKNKDVVFCEGYNLSNSQIIALMQNPLNNNNFWFHAQQSSSIIGSNSKNDFGKVIV